MEFDCGGCGHSLGFHTHHGCQHYGCNCRNAQINIIYNLVDYVVENQRAYDEVE